MERVVEMGRFLMNDCMECGDPQISVNCCEFDCFEGSCDFCYQQVWRQCPECGRTGCKEHFDGMYCRECINDSEK